VHDPFDPPDVPLWPTVRRLGRLWREQTRWLVGALVCAAGLTGVQLAMPILIKVVIDDAILSDRRDLLPLLAAFSVLALARFVLNFVRRVFTARVGIWNEARLRGMLYTAYLHFPRAFYDRHATGQVLSRATNDLYPIRYFTGWGLVQSCQSAMMIVGVGVVLVVVNPLLAAVAAIIMPLIGVIAYGYARRVVPLSRLVQQRKGDVTEAADEVVVGIEMVQAFGREEDVRGRFMERAQGVRDASLAAAGVDARYLPPLLFLPSLAIALVLAVGGRQVIDGELTLGEFVLFYTLLLQLAWPLEALGWIMNLAQRALASAGRTFAWLEGIPTLPEPADPKALPQGGLRIELEGVRFGYGSEDHEVLRGVDLQVEPGEIVAICGGTGSGKTTLMNLLPRFYDPLRGAVRLGGVDLRDLPIAALRADVAIVTQRAVLFSTTLIENVRAARPEASEREIDAACLAAGVDAFAPDLPQGRETLIGERGVNLSGGQRQRVALARALVAGARVIVLDDPLSAVDTETERLLVENLRPAVAGRTVLIAAQRLSTVEVADRAAVLVDGVIAEEGTPAELLAAGAHFSELFADEVVDA